LLEEIQKENISEFSERTLEYYKKKVNVGSIKDADVAFPHTGPCGDTIKLYLKINGNIIKDAKFEYFGCVASAASASVLTELIKGKTLEEAKKITEEDILKELGELPKSHLH
jgi:NifU-like protein involved in Fe-S cluster formation